MLEDLEREDAIKFLKEARRVLRHGGVIRISVPDIKRLVENYFKDADADNFVEETFLARKKPNTLFEKMRYLIIGDRSHQWMYDGSSLCKLLLTVGFQKPRAMGAGTTIIPEPDELDLEEREQESVFVEAINP